MKTGTAKEPMAGIYEYLMEQKRRPLKNSDAKDETALQTLSTVWELADVSNRLRPERQTECACSSRSRLVSHCIVGALDELGLTGCRRINTRADNLPYLVKGTNYPRSAASKEK
jgi:hypothetical protein